MPIIVGSGGSGSAAAGLSNYAELVAYISSMLNRDDLNDMIRHFIRMAEVELNRILRVPEMEETITLTTDSERLELPDDFRRTRALYLDTDPRQELENITLGTLRTKYACQTTGKPECFAVSGYELVLGPAPDDEYDLILTYFQEIPPLTPEDDVNWLLTDHPDIYVYGAICQAEAFLWNDERLPLWRNAYENAFTQLQDQGKSMHHGAAPIRLRASVRE